MSADLSTIASQAGATGVQADRPPESKLIRKMRPEIVCARTSSISVPPLERAR